MPPRGLGFAVEVEGAEKATYDLEQLGVRARDIRPAARTVRRVFTRSEETRFSRQGPGWPPLADTTRERKRREHLDPRVLRAKQVLYRSLASPQAALQLDRHGRQEFEFGTEVPYARFHEVGRGVPKRKLIDLRPDERRQIDEAIGEFIAQEKT